MKIGFIGQGFIGKAYADNYEKRGFDVVRYEKGKSYRKSKQQLSACDVVFIAVPTPTTPYGFFDGVVREVIKIVSPDTIVVIKSTVVPGTTKSIYSENPNQCILFSPEFLSEATAQYDADNPARNIIGVPIHNEAHMAAAEKVMATLPEAPFTQICGSNEAELIKYGKNTLGYLRVLHTNILYDYATLVDADFDSIKAAMAADPDSPGDVYLSPVHKSGRGAGGACFIKDFEAFVSAYERENGEKDHTGVSFLKAARNKNLALLRQTHKDVDLVHGVYGNNSHPL